MGERFSSIFTWQFSLKNKVLEYNECINQRLHFEKHNLTNLMVTLTLNLAIANPVGADQPAKRQKKTSCVSTGQPVPSTSALARWHVVLPSCLDRVMS